MEETFQKCLLHRSDIDVREQATMHSEAVIMADTVTMTRELIAPNLINNSPRKTVNRVHCVAGSLLVGISWFMQ